MTTSRTLVALALVSSACTLPSPDRIRVLDASDAAMDVNDSTVDSRSEASTDVVDDLANDTTTDVPQDTTIDDVIADDARDVATDTGVDSGADSGVDTGVDAGVDTGNDTGIDTRPASGPARLLWPTPGSTVSGRVPQYGWALPTVAPNIRIQFAGSRDFAVVGEEHSLPAATTEWRPTAPIAVATTAPSHRVYWRIAVGTPAVYSEAWPVSFAAAHVGMPNGAVIRGVTRDFDGDGYDDPLVGASGAGSGGIAREPGAMALYLSRGSPVVATSTAALLRPTTERDVGRFGAALAWIGDVNGDGLADFAGGFGGPRGDGIEIYYGNTTSPSRTPAILDRPATTDTSWGSTIAALGDIDRDGYADFAVAAGSQDRVSIVRGGPMNVTIASTLTSPMPSGNTAPSEAYGSVIVGACDFNGDGSADLAISGPSVGVGGSVFIYRGAGGAVVQTIAAPSGSGVFGRDMSCAGDLDGDGDHELVVSSVASGAVFVYRGNRGSATQPLGTTPVLLYVRTDDDAGLSNPGGFGRGVGDLDGDGYDDLIVSEQAQRLYVFLDALASPTTSLRVAPGMNLGLRLVSLGDLDRDGLADIGVSITDALGVYEYERAGMGALTRRLLIPSPMAGIRFAESLPAH